MRPLCVMRARSVRVENDANCEAVEPDGTGAICRVAIRDEQPSAVITQVHAPTEIPEI